MGKMVAALAALSAILGSTVTLAIVKETAPHCPEEDSCQIDYSNGAWHITEVTP